MHLGAKGPMGGAMKYLFGDGVYSGNIIQGGSVLQPQASYTASDGITYADCIVITGPATVAPDSNTGAASFSCRNLVLTGASAKLTASVKCKGLIGFVSGAATALNGAGASMSRLGKAGNFGDLTAILLAAPGISKRLSKKLTAYIIKGEGAPGSPGAPSIAAAPIAPAPAGAMQSGGGGGGGASGAGAFRGGNGEKGGPTCGGAAGAGGGGGGAVDAGPYGGPGGNATSGGGYAGAPGPGDPVGVGPAGVPEGPGGGLLAFFTPRLFIGTGCVFECDGSRGVNAYAVGGSGGAGAGIFLAVTLPGGFINQGTVRCAGGLGGGDTYAGAPRSGAPGGVGSINTFTVN